MARFTALGAIVAAVLFGYGALRSKLRSLEAGEGNERGDVDANLDRLRRKNEQLTSLYNVFSEITQTLTLRYVVQTTLREAQRIMSADMVVVAKREGDRLVVLGAMAAGGIEIKGLPDRTLDEVGALARAASKGRSVKIDNNAELSMERESTAASVSKQTGHAPHASGVITPLIVGARVVGLMSCWSQKPNHFDDDDVKLLEMMASSVATAIVTSEAVESSERRAHIDPLTELSNRRQLNEDLRSDLLQLLDADRNIVVVMADIDHFKLFNDNYGHKVGDVTLQTVAGVLRQAVRETDFIYRYGGEEFLVVFVDADDRQGEILAERLRTAVEAIELEQIKDGRLTISIGLACAPQHGDDMATLIERADAAMYQAKNDGRNRVTSWSPTISEPLAA